MDLESPQFWVAALQMIAIDVVLGGDNAVVIALACRRLPEKQRNPGIFRVFWCYCDVRDIDFFCAASVGHAFPENCGRNFVDMDWY